jgi:hypothetical protein
MICIKVCRAAGHPRIGAHVSHAQADRSIDTPFAVAALICVNLDRFATAGVFPGAPEIMKGWLSVFSERSQVWKCASCDICLLGSG